MVTPAFVPGTVALCPGRVWHERTRPAVHRFEYPVSYVWLDPDHPERLTDQHPWWSDRRPALARFRASDYGTVNVRAGLADQARDDLTAVLGGRPDGPVRMLTQVRRWGWLFNPITVYVAWRADRLDTPVGAVLEVTNTPWKERRRYPLALVPTPGDPATLSATAPKTLHVSPFLDESWRYAVRLTVRDPDHLDLAIDVVGDDHEPIVRTQLAVERHHVDRRALGRSLLTAFPTHRVSAGIHIQAARLWAKRVPFVDHPSKLDRSSREPVR